MKKTLLFVILFITSVQISFAQDAIAKIKYEEAESAYISNDFKTVVSKLDEAESLLGSTNPKILYLKIMSLTEIIKKDPLNDFKIIENARMLSAKYLKDYESLSDNMDKYKDIYKANELLKSYPEDETSFLKQKNKLADDEKARQAQIELNRKQEKARQEKEDEEKKIRIEEERVKQEKAAKEAEAVRIKSVEKHNKLSFKSVGFQSGEIAKYGFLYEKGSDKSRVGFHLAIRSSFTPDASILDGTITDNKSEIDIGPSFRIFSMLYLNLGVGYGQYKFAKRDDYMNTTSLETKDYFESSIGATIRIGRIININAGLSYIDIYKKIYSPELTFGISFNLQGKLK